MKVVMEVCFWCNKPTGRFGHDTDVLDPEEVSEAYGGYDPCPACLNIWRRHVIIAEYLTEPTYEGQEPLMSRESGEGVYPTGNYVIIDPGKIDYPDDSGDDIILSPGERFMISRDTWTKHGIPKTSKIDDDFSKEYNHHLSEDQRGINLN